MAAQNAASVLGEDWEAVEVVVEKMMKTGNFERITVADANGVVRARQRPGAEGQALQGAGHASRWASATRSWPSRYVVKGETMLGFDVPITFQEQHRRPRGLGIREAPLTAVARLSITLMVVLAVVTVLAVAVAMYFVANWFAKPIKLVGESMAEIAKGRFDHRINEHRKDEFGQLYAAFDAMARGAAGA
jgi:methyl-accepting chemotaxis protein